MAEKFIKKLTKKVSAIRYQMERGLSNTQISKSLGLSESTVCNYQNRHDLLEIKRSSKLPKNILTKYLKWLQIKQKEKC